jgi:zinc transport system permease protein
MMEFWYSLVGLLPFEWAHYMFMKNALLAVILTAPLFAMLGTMVISNHMAFFSDVLGHSTLTGIAIGVVLGFVDPFLPMLAFAILLAVGVNIFRRMTQAAPDTVLGVFFSMVVAFGLVLLSRGSGFAKFSNYLIGDILAVSPLDIAWLAVVYLIVIAYWIIFGNSMILTSISPVLARSRGLSIFFIETSFSVILAVVVASSIKLVGILIINSLLILPAAAARNICANMRDYTLWAIIISLVSGLLGLIASYSWGTACGATIVLFASLFYAITALWGWLSRGKYAGK